MRVSFARYRVSQFRVTDFFRNSGRDDAWLSRNRSAVKLEVIPGTLRHTLDNQQMGYRHSRQVAGRGRTLVFRSRARGENIVVIA
jgi:hypothetical protein